MDFLKCKSDYVISLFKTFRHCPYRRQIQSHFSVFIFMGFCFVLFCFKTWLQRLPKFYFQNRHWHNALNTEARSCWSLALNTLLALRIAHQSQTLHNGWKAYLFWLLLSLWHRQPLPSPCSLCCCHIGPSRSWECSGTLHLRAWLWAIWVSHCHPR